MKTTECMAVILAGGNGTRLEALTSQLPKPLIHFGSIYRIIDFTLSNCANSGISPMGILTQYRASEIHNYIGDGTSWDTDKSQSSIFMLPSMSCSPYTGTANAIFQNLDFIDQIHPEHLLILPSDHIYKMDYNQLLDFHKETDADVTISVTNVPQQEASRFGILNFGQDGQITDFWEKPQAFKGTTASMGVYLFKWEKLKKYLVEDAINNFSKHDFGKNIIPGCLFSGEKMFAYQFDGYWRDVGTIQSLWEANMDLLSHTFSLTDPEDHWNLLTNCTSSVRYVVDEGNIKNSIISSKCDIHGSVENSILCDDITISEGAGISNCVIMPDTYIGNNINIHKAVIKTGSWISKDIHLGAEHRHTRRPQKAMLIGS